MSKKIVSPITLFTMFLKEYKVWGWIITILMVVLGLLAAIFPFITASIAIWCAVAVVLIASVGGIIHFCVSKNRSGVVLAAGIVGIICVISFALFAAFWAKNFVPAPSIEEGFTKWYNAFDANLLFWFGYFMGFWGIINGIWTLCSLSSVEESKEGIAIAIGVVSILYGFFAVMFPFISEIVSVVITGVYIACLGVYGIYELATAKTEK